MSGYHRDTCLLAFVILNSVCEWLKNCFNLPSRIFEVLLEQMSNRVNFLTIYDVIQCWSWETTSHREVRCHYNCQVLLIFTLITSWVIHLSWNLPIVAHESNKKCPLKQCGTFSHRSIYYELYQSQRQALCLTEFSSQLKCWNCTASSKGEVHIFHC